MQTTAVDDLERRFAVSRRSSTPLSLDPTWLFVSLIPSGVGFVLFVYGQKQGRWPQLGAGLLLMVYPYFATSLAALVVTGAIIGFMLWYAIRLGW
jgi:hypothetical protein